MAVFRICYNRKSRWTVTASCLYLLCSTISCTAGSTERMRHHHAKLGSFAQLEKSRYEDGSKRAPPGCPNCLYENRFAKEKSDTDRLRLEAIKKQILQKLGLRHKPNVTHSLPRDVVWQTLERADDDSDFLLNRFEGFSSTSARSGTEETVDVDDFYGRTSEIISFAEEGSKVNQNRLLEFRASGAVQQDSNQVGQEFRVRSAALWLKAELLPEHLRRGGKGKCRTTDVYVFKIISNRIPESVTLSSRQFDRLTADPVTIPLEEHRPGWQKIDLTHLVSQWLNESSNDKLRLFVDCSCCSGWRVHLLNDERRPPVDDRWPPEDERWPPDDGPRRKSNPDRPFLVVHVDPKAGRRVRKRAIDCNSETGNQCCKQRFYVSFRDLGWDDWVIAPQGYHANYCRGDCGHPRTPDTYVTYHTHVMEEARKTQHLAGMTPCCAPLKFSSMSLIYYGPDSTIIKRDLPKMIVDECGCP